MDSIFSTGIARKPNITIDEYGTPYVIYSDANLYDYPTVMKFSAGSWIARATVVGGTPVNLYGETSAISFVSGNINNIYAAYTEYPNNTLIVLRYNGKQWTKMGNTTPFGSIWYPFLFVGHDDILYIAYSDYFSSTQKPTVQKIAPLSLGNPTIPSIIATKYLIEKGSSTDLSIDTGTLNDAMDWQWYQGSCGGTKTGTGKSIIINPNKSTTYFVRGEGNCLSAQGNCDSINIQVVPVSIGKNANENLDLNLYPNPAEKNVWLEFTLSSAEDLSVHLLDVTGSTVYYYPKKSYAAGDNKIEIDMTSLPRGIYICKLEAASKLSVWISKLVKD